MIPSNLNRCRFEILDNKQTRESTALSVAYYGITLSVGVGGGRGSWDVVGASQRGRIRTSAFCRAFSDRSKRQSLLGAGGGENVLLVK